MELAQLIQTQPKGGPSAAETHDILFATAELSPYSPSGGLADVAASLPRSLADLGHRVSIITPLYAHLDPDKLRLSRRIQPLQVPRLGKVRNKTQADVWETRAEGGVRIFFVEQQEFFGRQDTPADVAEPARFSFFSRAVVEFTRQYSVPVDVIHCNDWHTALAPIYRDHYYEDEMSDVAVVLTIHNLDHQGRFDGDAMSQTGLPKKFYTANQLREGDDINFLKGGIIHADQITTVSPTYAREIQTKQGGFGLDEVLSDRADHLGGILNGADYTVWSPEVDHYIDIQYDLDHLNGKRRNKAKLQHRFDLPIRPTLPMLAFIGRLDDQKGLDILLPAVAELIEDVDDERDGFQLLVLGQEGDNDYAGRIQALADRFPRRVAAHIGHDNDLAHKIQAGADLLVIPSRYEPCGLTQLYAMKYGTLPIVHATGGLADTVIDPQDDDELGTGFIFEDFDKAALRKTIDRATTRYRNYRKWRPLIETAMKQDFSWNHSAQQYIDTYNQALQR